MLLLKINATKSCAGVSLKTQELYLLVFVTRYLDLLYSFISLYNTCMKLIFIGSSGCIIWYMRKHRVVSQTYDAEQDTFRVVFLVAQHVARDADQPRVFVHRGAVDAIYLEAWPSCRSWCCCSARRTSTL